MSRHSSNTLPPIEQRSRCRVLVSSAWFEPGYRGGGPIRSVAKIVDTARDDTDLVLMTSDRDLGDRDPYPDVVGGRSARGRAEVYYLDRGSPGDWWRVLRRLRSERFDLLYVNSLFDPRFTLLPLVVARLGLLRARWLLIAPRGELSPGALALKGRKKRLCLKGLKVLLASDRVSWHASGEMEAANIQKVFPGARVIICPDQTSLPATATPPPAVSAGGARMVFLSRISPKKNLGLIISALATVTQAATLDVYGPIEDRAYWEKCRVEIARLPAHVTVTYRGEVEPTEVRATFGRYDVFVFPTLGENFGHVIAESLSASCSVVCSSHTPWTSVLSAGGGTVLSALTYDALADELGRLSALEPAGVEELRRRAGAAYDQWHASCSDANVIDTWRDSVADYETTGSRSNR